MGFEKLIDTEGAGKKGNFRMFTRLLKSVGNVDGTPSMTDTLVITIFKSGKIGVTIRGINNGGKEDGFNSSFSLSSKEGLEEDMPVFRDHIGVPVTGFIDEFKGRRVARIIKEEAVRFLNVGDMDDIADGTNGSNRARNGVDVVVPEDGRLPEALIAIRILSKVVSKGGEVFRVKDSINVTASEGKVFDIEFFSIDEVLFEGHGGIAFITMLTSSFTGKIGRMVGKKKMTKGLFVFLGEIVNGALIVFFTSTLFLANDNNQFFKIDIDLGGQRTKSHVHNFERFFIGRDDNDVINVSVLEPIRAEIGVEFFKPVLSGSSFNFKITQDSKNGGFKGLIKPEDKEGDDKIGNELRNNKGTPKRKKDGHPGNKAGDHFPETIGGGRSVHKLPNYISNRRFY